jgi:ATP-binding cassette, subfamily F, member 3
MLFRLEDVYKSYGAHEVLRGVTFQINPGDRVGLVGRNGAGKSTVFRLVTDAEEPDRGEVLSLRGLRLGLLEQQASFNGERTVLEEAISVFTELVSIERQLSQLEHRMGEATGEDLELVMHDYSELRHRFELEGGFTYHARAEAVIGGLGFNADDRNRSADQLSGGQKSRLALARLLLSEPDVLLLDEPTNHLDVDAVEWLEDFLNDYKSAFVIISHDRFLLDRTASKIVEIEAGRASVYNGNYSAYVKQRDERRLAQARQYEQQQEMIAKTEDFIRRNIAGQKTKQAKSRRNMLERLERVEAVRGENTGSFKLDPVARAGNDVLSIDSLSIGYGTNRLASNISFLLKRGERLGIIGPNGAGKTTFLKTILGEIDPLQGRMTWGANVKLDYFDQELASLDFDSTVIEEIAAVAVRIAEGELRNYLARFLFTGDDVFKSVASLSGGEQSRLALAKIIYGRANVLVLDEPTNHLDISSREALERALTEYTGTIITVSHDRYFLDKIATEILHFENGSAVYHAGSYSDFYNDHHRSHQSTRDATAEERPIPKPKKPRIQATAKTTQRSAEEIEKRIQALELELSVLVNQLASPPSEWKAEDYAEISERHRAISIGLETLYREWEAVHSAAG